MVRVRYAPWISVYICGYITHENLCRPVGNDSQIYGEVAEPVYCTSPENLHSFVANRGFESHPLRLQNYYD